MKRISENGIKGFWEAFLDNPMTTLNKQLKNYFLHTNDRKEKN